MTRLALIPVLLAALIGCGDSSDVAAVKRAVQDDIVRDRQIMRPSTVPPDLREQLSDIYAARVLDKTTSETADAIMATGKDATFREYDANRLTVTEWESVRVTDDSATATFLGYESWRAPGSSTFEADPVRRYRVVLAKESGKWKLVEEAQDDLPGQGG
jgi:hypothetical protein